MTRLPWRSTQIAASHVRLTIAPNLNRWPSPRYRPAMTEPPQIEIQHITKRFPGVTALDDVSFNIAAGEFHAIVGENGAGKSTLMKVLAGVITQYDGTLRLHGAPVRFQSTRDAEAAGVSIIHQELNLVDSLSAAANIFLGRERRRGWFLNHQQMESEAAAIFAELQCQISPRALVRDLRVGDRQLVEIAKALSLQANIVIMDEPTSALTETEVARLDQTIGHLRARGVTILYISHKMDEVFRQADTITVLRDGRWVRSLPRQQTGPREIAHLMVGREIEAASQHAPRTPGDVILDVSDLNLPRADGSARLSHISFSLRRGEVLGIAGLMGAGRTELLEALFGASPLPPTGQIVLSGQPATFHHPAEACQAGVALVTEDRKRLGLFPQLSVRENITVGSLPSAATALWVHSGRERQLAVSSMQELAVKAAGLEAAITSLSGGNQQKCILARWLLTRPQILLLDDPTRGVDVGAKAELYRIIDEFCRAGLGIIVTSSELPELFAVSDRILVLREGRLVGEFGRDQFREETIMEAATGAVN